MNINNNKQLPRRHSMDNINPNIKTTPVNFKQLNFANNINVALHIFNTQNDFAQIKSDEELARTLHKELNPDRY